MARRKKGRFDPDYRLKGWNNSFFAPKNSSVSITQVASIIPGLIVLFLWFNPNTKPVFTTLYGAIFTLFLFIFMWGMNALIIRRIAWRSIQRRMKKSEASPEQISSTEETFDFEQQTASSTGYQPRNLHEMSPERFEHEVAWIINALTDQKAVVSGGAGDGGVDIKVYQNKRLVGIVQCKRYDPNRALPPNAVRELYAIKQKLNVNVAYLVTTGKFTTKTRKEATEFGIKLIDGQKLDSMRQKARGQVRAT